MSLRTSVVIPRDATVTATGGTNITFTNDGRGTLGANVLLDVANSNFQTRQKIITRITAPAPAPNEKATAKLGRADVTVHTPFVAASGKIYTLPDNIQITYHPESTQAQIIAKRKFLAALIVDGEFDNFFQAGIND